MVIFVKSTLKKSDYERLPSNTYDKNIKKKTIIRQKIGKKNSIFHLSSCKNLAETQNIHQKINIPIKLKETFLKMLKTTKNSCCICVLIPCKIQKKILKSTWDNFKKKRKEINKLILV